MIKNHISRLRTHQTVWKFI